LASALAALRLPGVRIASTSFTPASGPFSGERCEGVFLRVDDRARFQPVRTGLALASVLARLHRDTWEPKNVALLLGHPPTFSRLLRGESLDALAAGWEPELRAFLELRKKYLLYPE
jgi:uncharacterized protein YbbC (DUF1343 family)